MRYSMEKDYEKMIEERANHLFEIMAQHVSDEELSLIKEAVKLVRVAFAANYSQNGEPYCIEILDYATYYATKSSPDTDYVVASILYPLNAYWEKVSNPVECNLDLNIKIMDLIYDGIEADRRMRSAENWSEPIYMPALHAVPEYPLTKDELISRGDPAPSDYIKFEINPAEEHIVDVQAGSSAESVIIDTGEEEVMLNIESGEEDIMSLIDTGEEEVVLRRRESEKENYELYERLMNDEYYHGPGYEWPSGELYENMGKVKQLVNGYWKPRYLLDFGRKVAFEVLDGNMCWKYFSVDDIDWDSMKGLDSSCIDRARRLSAHYPSFIYRFEDGVAMVEWQLCPDGMYWMDEDGYGRTSDEEVCLYGVIDKNMNVLVKFRYIEYEDLGQLKVMKEEARRMVDANCEK